MKIFFCDNRLGGLLGFRTDVIRHFADQGHEVCLVVPPAVTDWDKIGFGESRGVRIIYVKMQPSGMNPVSDARLFLQYLRIYRRERPDIVFNYTIKPNVYSSIAARMCGCRVVCMLAGLGYMFDGDNTLKRLGRWIYKCGLDKAEHVLVLNKMNYNKLRETGMVSDDRLLLLAGGEGVNLCRYARSEACFDGVTFLMVSRILYDKGYMEFIEAAKIVKTKYPDVRFQLLGPLAYDSPMGVEKEKFEKDMADNVVEYLGVSDDVPSIMGKEDVVVVLPSKYREGLNRSLMEACAIGRPIITTDIPGCAETVCNGKNGFVIPPASANDLAEAMIRFIRLPEAEKRDMASCSHEMAEKYFNVDDVVDVYEHIIRNTTMQG